MGCSNFDKTENDDLSMLSKIRIITDDKYISKLIKTNVQNSLNINNNINSIEKDFKLELSISEKIEGSILANSIRKIEITTDFKIIDEYTNQIVYESSFSRNSLLGPIDSLFSREQSERNARKRLGISISNDIIIRLIQWAKFSYK
tara:strand:+ start:186 stop:623 length:438 start_codon:yes stop_codon:yes gene_type:complete